MKKRTKKHNPNKAAQSLGMDLRDMGMSGAQASKHIIQASQKWAILKNDKRDLTKTDIELAIKPMTAFLDAVNAGTCEHADYWANLDCQHMQFQIMNELSRNQLSSDEITDMTIKLDLEINGNKLQSDVADAMQDIAARFEKTGKWGVNAQERSILLKSLEYYRTLLGVCNYAIYYRAKDATEKFLLPHYQRKQKEAAKQCNTADA